MNFEERGSVHTPERPVGAVCVFHTYICSHSRCVCVAAQTFDQDRVHLDRNIRPHWDPDRLASGSTFQPLFHSIVHRKRGLDSRQAIV